MSSFKVLCTCAEKTAVEAKACVKALWGPEGSPKEFVLQGSLSLLSNDDGRRKYTYVTTGLPDESSFLDYMLRVEVVKEGGSDATGTRDILLPPGKWILHQPKTKPSRSGKHKAFVIKVSFEVTASNPLHSVEVILPIIDDDEEKQRLFFGAIVHAEGWHRR
ncbi:hypothetical protein SEMRO_10_G007990.1 [Seminavis robusta]|uniref:Uncharacterized protein n=1 Tax=Seminavis robusta TaxID=568900 RepID=A0A9N8DBT3_9STRA|nr:hypothetical protein SEMRO_10_G007990.1 [Seminavis robusta]|eukprot:Sro10_g007990.1 n/a (162) ;mRNA; r:75214-75699